jgi:GNAT superfamily N-acetyltransferase
VLSARELNAFIRFPHALYKGNPCWLPPLSFDERFTLSKAKNPAFENCEARYWLAYRDGKIVGRIAGIINHAFIDKWKEKCVRFGWIDFTDDAEVSGALLDAVETWARQKGMEAIHGPLGFTDFDPEGMLVEGFDKVGTMTTIYNYAYYPAHLGIRGYNKAVDWVEYEVDIPSTVSDRVKKIAARAAHQHRLRVLKARSSRELRPYARKVFELLNVCYAGLYGVVTLTPTQIDAYISQFFSFIHPDYVSLVLRQEEVVAFAIAMPSMSHALQKAGGNLLPFGFFHLFKALHWNDAADLYLIAVHPDLQDKGVTSLLIEDLNMKFIRHGIRTATTHPMLEENGKMLAFWKGFNTTQVRRRRCYVKHLG